MAKSEQIVSYLSIEAWKEALVMSKQAKKEQVIKLRNTGLSFGEIAKELALAEARYLVFVKGQMKNTNADVKSVVFY